MNRNEIANKTLNKDWTYPEIIDTSYLIGRDEVTDEKGKTYVL